MDGYHKEVQPGKLVALTVDQFLLRRHVEQFVELLHGAAELGRVLLCNHGNTATTILPRWDY